MRDLEQRLHGVDEVPVPDVAWPKSDAAGFEDGRGLRRPKRTAPLVVGLVVAALAVVLVVEVFGGIGSTPEQGPARNGSIAFLANGPKGSVGQNEDIFAIDPAVGALSNLSRTPGVVEGSPRWSPDGSHVVFTEYTGSRQRNVVLANGDLSAPQVIEGCDCEPVSFAWSPDGLHIAWTGSIPKGKGYTTALQTYDLSSGAVSTICDSTTCGIPGEPVWSPDGTQIAFSNAGYAYMTGPFFEQGPIWIADAASGTVRALTNTTPCTTSPVISGQACIFDSRPFWSVDGTSLYFVRSISRGHAGSETLMEIMADGSDLTRLRACGRLQVLTGCDLELYGPSPDGSQLAYRSGNHLQVLDLQSNHVIPIRLPDETRFGEAVWSPDGTELAVVSGSQDGSIWVVDTRTGTAHVVANGLRWPSDLAWLPATSSVEASPSIDCCGGTPTGTGNLEAPPQKCPRDVSYSPWPGSDEQMVPGAPVVAVVCTYHPASSNPDRYLHPSRTVLTGDSLNQLVHALNSLPTASTCSSLGQEVLKEGMYFSYGSSTQLQVVGVLLGGCPIVQNGAMQWVGTTSDDVAQVLRASQ